MNNNIVFLLSFLFFLIGCMADNVDKEKNTEQQDYYQFQHINLKNYDIDATIMIPDATAGIGASFKPQIHHIPGDYKWHIQIGRSFNLQIEDFGDNAYRYAEMRKKIFQNKAFRVSIVKEDIDQVLYERVLDNSYHITH